MGFPAAELYFSEDFSPAAPVQQPVLPTLVEVSPEPVLEDKIKIIGIGGGGRNALNHIISNKTDNVGFLAVDTDVRNLEKSVSPNKIILGKRGIGAGCIPQNGEEAARESLGEIMEFMRGADMVYLTAGMGGGTGTGAIPVIAAAARNLGILTVAVVTKPFAFEGARKMRMAVEGIEKLVPVVDALIVIPNEKLLENSDLDTGIPEAFAKADEVLRQAVLGVTELITRPGMVNMDFADVKAVMSKSGISVMGTGRACGENRIEEALKQAMESPLMEFVPSDASGMLMNITSAGTLTLFELQQAASIVEECINETTTFVWGTAEDPELGDDVKVTIIATGISVRSHKEDKKQETAAHWEGNQPFAYTEKETKTTQTTDFLEVTLPKRQVSDTEKPFIPVWLRTQQKESENKNTQPEKTKAETAEMKESAELHAKNFFGAGETTEYDLPSCIRRKKTAPEINGFSLGH